MTVVAGGVFLASEELHVKHLRILRLAVGGGDHVFIGVVRVVAELLWLRVEDLRSDLFAVLERLLAFLLGMDGRFCRFLGKFEVPHGGSLKLFLDLLFEFNQFKFDLVVDVPVFKLVLRLDDVFSIVCVLVAPPDQRD